MPKSAKIIKFSQFCYRHWHEVRLRLRAFCSVVGKCLFDEDFFTVDYVKAGGEGVDGVAFHLMHQAYPRRCLHIDRAFAVVGRDIGYSVKTVRVEVVDNCSEIFPVKRTLIVFKATFRNVKRAVHQVLCFETIVVIRRDITFRRVDGITIHTFKVSAFMECHVPDTCYGFTDFQTLQTAAILESELAD